MTIESLVSIGDSIFVYHQHMLTNEEIRKAEGMQVWYLACHFEDLANSIIAMQQLTESTATPLRQAVFAVRFERLGTFEKKWPELRAKIMEIGQRGGKPQNKTGCGGRRPKYSEEKKSQFQSWWGDYKESLEGKRPSLEDFLEWGNENKGVDFPTEISEIESLKRAIRYDKNKIQRQN